jgi:RNA recognition motif-containing protein
LAIKPYLACVNLGLANSNIDYPAPHLSLSYFLLSSNLLTSLNFHYMNIYVSNLSFDVQDEELKGFFTPYGEVTSAKIISDKTTGQSRGFGFVEMSDTAAAKKAIAELNNAEVDGRNIKVMEARPKEERAPRDNRGGGGGGYNKNRW